MATRRGAHPEDEALERNAMGRLEEPELGELEEHLLVCEPCQHRQQEMDEYVAVARDACRQERDEAPDAPPAPGWILWLRQAGGWGTGAALAAAAVALAVWIPSPGPAPGPPQTVELESVRSAAAPDAAAGRALRLRLDVGGLRREPLRGFLVTETGEPSAELDVTRVEDRAEAVWEPGLKPGNYVVRLRQNGATVREYILRVR